MKKIFILFISLATFLATGTINAQTLDEVLQKHHKAMGQDKLAKMKTYTIDALVNQMGMELPMTMKMKRPDKFRMEIDMQGQKMIQAFDGEKGWAIAPWMSPDPATLEGDQLEQAKEQANIDGPFYKYKEKGYKAELAGKENYNGKDCFKVILTKDDGNVQTFLIDPETYYILLVKGKVNAQGTELDVETSMSNYQVVDGIAMAMDVESNTSMGSVAVKIKKVEYNTGLDDAIFKRPEK